MAEEDVRPALLNTSLSLSLLPLNVPHPVSLLGRLDAHGQTDSLFHGEAGRKERRRAGGHLPSNEQAFLCDVRFGEWSGIDIVHVVQCKGSDMKEVMRHPTIVAMRE